jgi:hypothetical protein
LIGCEIIAIDGTKAAHNSKANFNQRKLRDIAYIEEQTRISELAKNDLQDNSITITKIAEKIERLKRINTLRTSRRKTKEVDNPK